MSRRCVSAISVAARSKASTRWGSASFAFMSLAAFRARSSGVPSSGCAEHQVGVGRIRRGGDRCKTRSGVDTGGGPPLQRPGGARRARTLPTRRGESPWKSWLPLRGSATISPSRSSHRPPSSVGRSRRSENIAVRSFRQRLVRRSEPFSTRARHRNVPLRLDRPDRNTAAAAHQHRRDPSRKRSSHGGIMPRNG